MNPFEKLGIDSDILEAIKELGYENPTPVQEKVIPSLLNDERDIIALAQTGTGKTAAFGIPLIQSTSEDDHAPVALILSPTRELCVQVTEDLKALSKFKPGIKVVAVYGGASTEGQIKALRAGANIIVATPGRLIDLMKRKVAKLSGIRRVVLDEADEMLRMGFIDDVNEILAACPPERITLLFSATFPTEIKKITRNYMKDPLLVEVGERNVSAVGVEHLACVLHAKDKYPALKRFLDSFPGVYTIIFSRTRKDTQELATHLMKDGFAADSLHGDLSQSQRDYVMQRFKLKQLRILIATDVAARGIDVVGLTHVIHYQLPDDPEVYTHRSGRTARAGKKGISLAFAHHKERGKLKQIERMTNCNFAFIPVPSGKDILESQVQGLIDRIESADSGDFLSDEILEAAAGRLAYLTPQELIGKVTTLALTRIVKTYQNVPEIQTLEGEKGSSERSDRISKSSEMVALKINLGRSDEFLPLDLMGMVNDLGFGKDVNIGQIEIRSDETLFEVEKEFAQSVIDGILNSGRVDDTIRIEMTDEKVKKRESRGGGRSFNKREGGGGYGGKREGGYGGKREGGGYGNKRGGYGEKKGRY